MGNGVKCHIYNSLDRVLCSITGMGWMSLENVLTRKLVSYTFHVSNSQHMNSYCMIALEVLISDSFILEHIDFRWAVVCSPAPWTKLSI
jgi:hypothetical protein